MSANMISIPMDEFDRLTNYNAARLELLRDMRAIVSEIDRQKVKIYKRVPATQRLIYSIKVRADYAIAKGEVPS